MWHNKYKRCCLSQSRRSSFSFKKNKLDTIILEKDLGTIRFVDILVPTRSEILFAIKNKNPDTTKFLMENDFGFKKGSTV